MSLDKRALDAWITREQEIYDEEDVVEEYVPKGIVGQFSDFEEMMLSGLVDEFACHKKCGEYYSKCRCEFGNEKK
jgi:hypothetical protein